MTCCLGLLGHFRVFLGAVWVNIYLYLENTKIFLCCFAQNFLVLLSRSLSKKKKVFQLLFYLGHFGVSFVHFGACFSNSKEPFNVHTNFCVCFFFELLSNIICHKWSWAHSNEQITLCICKYVYLHASWFLLLSVNLFLKLQ